uniref:CTCK domain-containing protein n=1 Tax=Sinocyclocheilus rhinocerous TaxID=307959 RepID=A0A673I707_9TELE
NELNINSTNSILHSSDWCFLGNLHRYSMYTNDLMHSCSCCKEANVTNKTVTLKCANSSEIRHNYKYINSCTCTPMTCKDQNTTE